MNTDDAILIEGHEDSFFYIKLSEKSWGLLACGWPTAMIWTILAIIFAFAILGNTKETLELSDEIKEIIQHVHNECVGKTGVAEEDIQNCEKGIFKEDKKLKCYMFCLMEEANLVEDDGSVDYDMVVSIIPEEYTERAKNMIFSCKHLDSPDKDKCQRAFDVHKCSYDKDPDFYFLF